MAILMSLIFSIRLVGDTVMSCLKGWDSRYPPPSTCVFEGVFYYKANFKFETYDTRALVCVFCFRESLELDKSVLLLAFVFITQ